MGSGYSLAVVFSICNCRIAFVLSTGPLPVPQRQVDEVVIRFRTRVRFSWHDSKIHDR